MHALTMTRSAPAEHRVLVARSHLALCRQRQRFVQGFAFHARFRHDPDHLVNSLKTLSDIRLTRRGHAERVLPEEAALRDKRGPESAKHCAVMEDGGVRLV